MCPHPNQVAPNSSKTQSLKKKKNPKKPPIIVFGPKIILKWSPKCSSKINNEPSRHGPLMDDKKAKQKKS